MPTYATSTVAAPMPNLENLRKQAKLILRWHRDRYYPVAAQIRSGLPRFSQMTDPDILAHSFKLSDAQELVARQHGFEGWQALKEGLSTMPDHADTTSAAAVITAAEPQLFVADIKTSCDFFTGKLGFTVVFTYGEPPFYAQVARDAARINLRCVAKPPIDPELRDREDSRRFPHGRDGGRDQKTLPRVSVGGRHRLPDAEAGALGCAQFHRERSGRQSAAIRRPRGVTTTALATSAAPRQGPAARPRILRASRRSAAPCPAP